MIHFTSYQNLFLSFHNTKSQSQHRFNQLTASISQTSKPQWKLQSRPSSLTRKRLLRHQVPVRLPESIPQRWPRRRKVLRWEQRGRSWRRMLEMPWLQKVLKERERRNKCWIEGAVRFYFYSAMNEWREGGGIYSVVKTRVDLSFWLKGCRNYCFFSVFPIFPFSASFSSPVITLFLFF